MGRMSSKICACAFAGTILFTSTLCACSSKKKGEENSVRFWAAPSYIKIYQDIDYSKEEDYSVWYNSSDLNVCMFINEKEGGQVILTPNYDVDKYTVSVSDLVAENGEKIGKENIAVYHQKYVDVNAPSAAHTNSVLGMVPDAILPFDKAVEYGENSIAKAQNQGVYVEFDSADVSAGQYFGNMEIVLDEKVQNVKMSVTVWDAEVSKENHLRTSFLLRAQELLANEKDGTDEMYQTYYDQFLDYRVNITKFTQSFDEETYIEGLRKYYYDPMVATVHFPRCENSARTNYDFDQVQYWYQKIAELCFEDETNYFDKMYYYLAVIDEPKLTKTEDKVVPIYKNFAIARHSVIKELQTNRANYQERYNVSDELFDSVLYEIENFELLLTSAYDGAYVYENNKSTPENPDEAYVITWCPYMDQYDTPASADRHINEGLEEWWYGCNYPVNPYPTYHLDDAIVTARIFSWMSYEHDVIGNLYWRVNYSSEQNSFGKAESLEDPYDITNFSQETNGEGLLVYPGMPYGIKGFVPSIRLVAIRDGMEEYEVLRSTGDICKELAASAGYENFDVNITFSKLYESLYKGTKVTGDAHDFTKARELLASLAVFAEKGTIITDVQNKAFATQVKVFVEDGTLKIDGVEADFEAKGNGKEYTVEIKQTDEANYLRFTIEQGEESSAFEMFVGGKKQALDLSEITFGGNDSINELSTVKNADGSVTVTAGALKLKEDGSRWEDETQRVYLTGSLFAQQIHKEKNVNAIVIEIENPGDEFDVIVRYKATRKGWENDILEFTKQHVKANDTTLVTIETGSLSWDFEAVKELRLYLQYADVYQEHTITVKSIILTH